MSTSYLRVIPTDPWWVPDAVAAEAARAALARLAPGARSVKIETWPRVEIVDPAGNLERILCPACGSQLDVRWWGDMLDAAWDDESGFHLLDVTTPCCGCDTSLNDLNYTWACGFARFKVEAKDYDRWFLEEDELAELAKALGHGVRVIYAHF